MIKYTSDEVESILRFQHKRICTSLFRGFLTLIENLEDEHGDLMEKLHTALPEQYKAYVDLVDYWTPTRAEAIRKHILDGGNDAIRNLDEMLINYDISLKQQK
jgi:hypothetical protein